MCAMLVLDIANIITVFHLNHNHGKIHNIISQMRNKT